MNWRIIICKSFGYCIAMGLLASCRNVPETIERIDVNGVNLVYSVSLIYTVSTTLFLGEKVK